MNRHEDVGIQLVRFRRARGKIVPHLSRAGGEPVPVRRAREMGVGSRVGAESPEVEGDAEVRVRLPEAVRADGPAERSPVPRIDHDRSAGERARVDRRRFLRGARVEIAGDGLARGAAGEREKSQRERYRETQRSVHGELLLS